MTFRKRHRFLRRFALTLAFAAMAAPAAPAMRTPDEPGVPSLQGVPRNGGSAWDDAILATGSAAALAGIAGGTALVLRARKGPRLARA